MIRYITFMSLCLVFSIAQLASAQFPNKNSYKLPAGVTTEDIEPNRIQIKLKPEYRTAFETSNPLTNTLQTMSVQPAEQIYPNTRKRRQLRKGKKFKTDITLIYDIKLEENVDIFQAIDQVVATGMVEIAEPVPVLRLSYTPNDPDVIRQSYLEDIKAMGAWTISKGDTSVVVGVVDSGFDFNHPDFEGKVAYNWNDPIDGIDNDEDGFTDNFSGWDFAGGSESAGIVPDNDPQLPTAGVDHGISVAGCAAAATDNGIGIAGVGFDVKVMSTKHSFDDNPDALTIVAGYQGVVYLAEQGIKIINCSWGGDFRSELAAQVMDYVIEDLGCLVVVAAGNDGENKGQYPAAYDGVLSVGATNGPEQATSFTNYDYSVDLTAPGQGIFTTFHLNGNQYSNTSGTSFSSPIVAGAAGLVWSHRPELSPRQVGELLRMTADPIDEFNDRKYGGKLGQGRLNVERAMTENPPAVRIKDFSFKNTNGSDVIYAGDEVAFNAEFINYLAPTEADFLIRIEAVDNSLSAESAVIYEGVIQTDETISLPDDLIMDVSPSLENFGEIALRFTFTQGNYQSVEYAALRVNPNYQIINGNDIVTSVNNTGTIGRHEEVTTGEGFVYKDIQTLYELGLMYANANNRVVSAVRGTSQGEFDNDFRSIRAVAPIETDEANHFAWEGEFNDGNAGSSRLNINTTHKTQLWTSSGAEKFVIIEYIFENNSFSPIRDFYAGLYGDWDIGDASANKAKWDSQENTAYISSDENSLPFVGISVVNLFAEKATASVVANDDSYPGTPYGVFGGFSDMNKFRALQGTSPSSIGFGNPTDVSVTVGGGPYTIPANGKIVIAFVLAAGDDEASIRASVAEANRLYEPSIEIVDEITALEDNGLTKSIRLFPNPATDEVKIDFVHSSNSRKMNVSILNILGQQLKEFELTKESNVVNISSLPSGQYILKFNDENMVGTKTLIVR